MIFERYERKSLAITVNQLFPDWEQVFPEVTMSYGRRNSTLFACLKNAPVMPTISKQNIDLRAWLTTITPSRTAIPAYSGSRKNWVPLPASLVNTRFADRSVSEHFPHKYLYQELGLVRST
ncbi:hypothetical protein Lferr_0220 [Acidithiobacillus ferrooxidans ATCC 53993]|jgi:hypothetical protein|uniref:hypothetical protein n=1 Tax=Acidithiobacillus ferrooxidans TaxID=920 RepID=UPI00017F6D15|nr:hypothetical protein [Acidithiobacillus ferrooxidans]ACH82478.1 hypothetical protein Lferr_0220 [Acidithiobacillus ferrooxidans ATCC 53993]